jgi:hypothetical protein
VSLLACSMCALRGSTGGGWTIAIMVFAPFAVAAAIAYVARRAGRAR